MVTRRIGNVASTYVLAVANVEKKASAISDAVARAGK